MGKGGTKAFLNKQLYFLLVISLVSLVISMVMFLIGMFEEGCWFRYAGTGNNSSSIIYQEVKNLSLKANGNYSYVTSTTDNNVNLDLAPDKYGQWLNSSYLMLPNSKIKIDLSGEVSLCRAYLPEYNVMSNLSTNLKNNPIPIPRINENIKVVTNIAELEGLPLMLSSNTNEWRNLAEVFVGDKIEVRVKPNVKQSGSSNTIVKNVFDPANPIIADCGEGKRSYSPICGRYNVTGGQIAAECKEVQYSCEWSCKYYYRDGSTKTTSLPPKICNNVHSCFKECEKNTPESYVSTVKDFEMLNNKNAYCTKLKPGFLVESDYLDNGTNTYSGPILSVPKFIRLTPYKTIISLTNPSCVFGAGANLGWLNYLGYLGLTGKNSLNDKIYGNYDYINFNYSAGASFLETRYKTIASDWFIAENATGLHYMYSSELKAIKEFGSSFAAASDIETLRQSGMSSGYPMVLKTTVTKNMITDLNSDEYKNYLKFRLLVHWNSSEELPNESGGYTLYLKQNKCVRNSGRSRTDTHTRGAVKYLLLVPGQDPNIGDPEKKYTVKTINFSDVNNTSVEITNDSNTVLIPWFIIDNNPTDAADSAGQYTIKILAPAEHSNKSFNKNVINPLMDMIDVTIKNAFGRMMKNMICYQFTDTSGCTNIFILIKAALVMYIILLTSRFALGLAQLNQMELLTSIIKIVIIASLIDNVAFEFFMELYDYISKFIQILIMNFSGYAGDPSEPSAASTFLISIDPLMTRIFFDKAFFYQLVALIGMGTFGIVYFVIFVVGIIMGLLALLKGFTVFLISKIYLAITLSLAPIFLIFMLFEPTRHLFENWLKYISRFILEPIIMLGGITILIRFMTIYLDDVLAYSVCWKCAIPIQIPLKSWTSILPDIKLFCINWPAPWGRAISDSVISFPKIIGTLIISSTLENYVEVADGIVSSLTVDSTMVSSTEVTSKGGAQGKDGKKTTRQKAVRQFAYKNTQKLLNTDFSKLGKKEEPDNKKSEQEEKSTKTINNVEGPKEPFEKSDATKLDSSPKQNNELDAKKNIAEDGKAEDGKTDKDKNSEEVNRSKLETESKDSKLETESKDNIQADAKNNNDDNSKKNDSQEEIKSEALDK